MLCVSHYLSELTYLHIYRLNYKANLCFEIKCMAGIESEDEIKSIINVKFGKTHERSLCAVLCMIKNFFSNVPW